MKKVRIRILKAKNVCTDTTVGKVYAGTLYQAGESYSYIGKAGPCTVTAQKDTVAFMDDKGDHVGTWVTDGNVEILKDKPKVRVLASGRRQFDVNFKVAVVRHCDELRRTKTVGIEAFLKSVGVTSCYLSYWRKQKAQGHFSTERAVAFSRKDKMIHG